MPNRRPTPHHDHDCRLSPPRQFQPRLGNPGTHPTRRPRQSRTPCTEQPPLQQWRVPGSAHRRPWRDLPSDYGHWGSTYNRFRNWQKDGAWERFLDILANDPDLEWLVIDYSYVKAHQYVGSVSFQVVWLVRPCSCNSASRLCSVHTVSSFSRRRNSRLCRSKRDVVRCDACPVAR